jgi:acetyltransferase EpsM
MKQLKDKLFLYGAGAHAAVIFSVLKDLNKIPNGVIDDNADLKNFYNISISDIVDVSAEDDLIISIGDNFTRKKVAEKLAGYRFYKAFHPTAYIGEFCTIEEGTVIMQNATVQINSKIGSHCIINTGACVDHDCIIGDYCHVSPNATLTGNVHLGEGTWVGAGAVILPGVKIGNWCIVGAGSVVTRDIGNSEVVVGVPARRMNR